MFLKIYKFQVKIKTYDCHLTHGHYKYHSILKQRYARIIIFKAFSLFMLIRLSIYFHQYYFQKIKCILFCVWKNKFYLSFSNIFVSFLSIAQYLRSYIFLIFNFYFINSDLFQFLFIFNTCLKINFKFHLRLIFIIIDLECKFIDYFIIILDK